MEEEIKKALDANKEEILEAIQLFSCNVDKQFGEVNKQFSEVNKQFGEVNKQFGEVDKQFDGIRNELKVFENKMVDGFSSIRSEIAQVKREIIARIEKLENRDKEDTDALTQNYFELETRVKKLEQKLQQLQTA